MKNLWDSKEAQVWLSGFKMSFVVRSLTIKDRQSLLLQMELREHIKLYQFTLGIQVIYFGLGKI